MSSSPYWLPKIFLVSLCSVTCLLMRSVCGIGNSSQQMPLQCLSTINIAFSDEDTIFITKHINTLSIHIYTCRGIKIGVLKMQFLRIFPYLLNICTKFEFLISQGSAATCLKWGGYCCLGFVANFTSFPAVQTFWKSVKIWQSYREFKGGNFFGDTVYVSSTMPNFMCIY